MSTKPVHQCLRESKADDAVRAMGELREYLRSEDGMTDKDIRAALTEVTDAYDGLIYEFCRKPSVHHQGAWNAWNVLGSADHYAFLQTATREP